MSMIETKGPRPYHVATERMKFPKYDDAARAFAKRIARKGYKVEWQPADWVEPRYPGDSIMIVHLVKGDEIGDVRVQWYGDYAVAQPGDRLKVGTFLPGVVECSPGDTPKVWPEKSAWVNDRAAASKLLIQYLIVAFRDGWSVKS